MRSLKKDRHFKVSLGMAPKVVAITVLVLAVVSGMLFVNYKMIMSVRNSIVSVVDNNLKDIVKNAATGRSLAKISSEVNLLINTFSSKEVFLNTARKRLVKELENIDTSYAFFESDEFRFSLEAYTSDVKKVLKHCEQLDLKMKDIVNLEKDIEQHLVHLKEMLSEQELLLLAEGGGKYLIDKGNRMLPVYRQYSLWVSNQIYRLNQAYVSTGPVHEGTNQTILRLFDNFDTSLTELTLSGTVFAEIGRQLRQTVFIYQKHFSEYYALLTDFRPLLFSMRRSHGDVVAISEKIDEQVNANSEMTKSRILKSISHFTFISTTIFILFNSLSAILCFFIIKTFKVSRLARNLQHALNEIKVLRGILPICMHCKKIRDDSGYWNQIEAYIADHSDAEFSHSICQECAEKYYPDMGLYDK